MDMEKDSVSVRGQVRDRIVSEVENLARIRVHHGVSTEAWNAVWKAVVADRLSRVRDMVLWESRLRL